MLRRKRAWSVHDEDEGVKICVMRWWPRGIPSERFDHWWTDLAPSARLLRKYHDENPERFWPTFAKDFRQEILKNVDALFRLERISNLLMEGKNVTLFCSEREDDPHCHTYLLMLFVEEMMRGEFIGPASEWPADLAHQALNW